jgi:hypothetical protein
MSRKIEKVYYPPTRGRGVIQIDWLRARAYGTKNHLLMVNKTVLQLIKVTYGHYMIGMKIA